MKLGDRIGVMHAGKLLQLGPPAEILGQPADDFVAELVQSGDRVADVAGS
jgi:ABC-type proline/glycine betaine transport system ATPase subunit